MNGQNAAFSVEQVLELDQEHVSLDNALGQMKKRKNAIQNSAPGQVLLDMYHN